MNSLFKIVAVCVLGAVLEGCGNAPTEISLTVPEETRRQTAEAAEIPQTEPQETQAVQTYEDNFAVDTAAAEEFAQKVKDAVAAKDLVGLAELTAFPVYVGLSGVGGVETREAFLELGADAVFTDTLMEAVAAAQIDNLQPSRAGFVVSNGGTANINFGVRDGVLAISGINY